MAGLGVNAAPAMVCAMRGSERGVGVPSAAAAGITHRGSSWFAPRTTVTGGEPPPGVPHGTQEISRRCRRRCQPVDPCRQLIEQGTTSVDRTGGTQT
jgi:hypothetical protein